MRLQTAIQHLKWSKDNLYLIVKSDFHKTHNFGYWSESKANYDREQIVLGYWQNGQWPTGALDIWARYYFWWAVLIEYTYNAENGKTERFYYSDGSHVQNYFLHLGHLLRNARDVELGMAESITRRPATVAQVKPEYIAIVGSRFKVEDYTQTQRDKVQAAIMDYIGKLSINSAVVSGAAQGVDRWAAQAARQHGLEVIEYPANWDKFGKSAGYIRNQDIINKADRVVAFYDGKSKGTAHSIGLAQKVNKPLEIIEPLKPDINDLDAFLNAA